MEKIRPNSLARRLSPLGTAGVALASSTAASAAVVHYAGPAITSSASFSIDASGDDFSFSFSAGSPDFYTGDPKFPFIPGTPSSFTLDPIDGQALITSTSVAFGEVVDASDTFTSDAITPVGYTSSYYGFSLVSGETLYGWIKVTYAPGGMVMPPGSGSIDEWAYDDSGASIMVGQTTAIPEPASAGALAALLAGSVAAWKRRRRQDLVAA